MENQEKKEYTTAEYYEMYGDEIKVNFNIDYLSTQPSGSISCSAHAEAMMLSMYYDIKFDGNEFWNKSDETSGEIRWNGSSRYDNISKTVGIEADDKTEYVYNLQYIDYKEDDVQSKKDAELKYYNQIKQYLDIGIPVEICVDFDNSEGRQTHYITIIGYKDNCTSLDDLLMADPATSDKDEKVNYVTSSYDELYRYEGESWKYGYHIITPNILIDDKEYVLDENGNIVDIFKRDENGDIVHDKNDWVEYLDEPKVMYKKEVTDDGSVYYLDDSGDIFSINNGIPESIFKYSDGESISYDLYKYIESILDIYPSYVNKNAIVKEIIGKTGRHINRDECERIIKAFEDKSVVTGATIKQTVTYAKSNVATARITRYDPLIFDLDGDGYNVDKKELGSNFDLDKNGFAEKINWTKKDGFLCLDLNGNGAVDDGGELFGDQTLLADGTQAKNGFEALAQYDSNGDGVIDADDEIFDKIKRLIFAAA